MIFGVLYFIEQKLFINKQYVHRTMYFCFSVVDVVFKKNHV